jgi:hypothetical protein
MAAYEASDEAEDEPDDDLEEPDDHITDPSSGASPSGGRAAMQPSQSAEAAQDPE